MASFEVKQSTKLQLTSYSGLALMGQCFEAAQLEAVIDPRVPVSQGMRTSPLKYFLSTLPIETPLDRLVYVTKMRWRIERDYRELKQEFGLGQYEGRNWRGLHHHATLCIAAYGFLLHQRLTQGSKKNAARPQAPVLPEGFVPRGGGKRTAAYAGFDRLAATPHRNTHRKTTHAMSMLRNNQPGLSIRTRDDGQTEREAVRAVGRRP